MALVEDVFLARGKWSRETGREFLMDQVAGDFCREAGIPSDEDFCTEFVDNYMREWRLTVRPVPGGSGLLHRLARHYRLGLISNTHHPPAVYQLLEAMDLRNIFEVITLSAEIGMPKPNREIFDATLAPLGLEPGSAVYIGDSFESDYQGARGAGIAAYLIGKHARVPRDHLLRSILDLPIHFDISA